MKYEEDIDTYMPREVLPHVPDTRKPVVKTARRIPSPAIFTSTSGSEELKAKFMELELSLLERVARLFE